MACNQQPAPRDRAGEGTYTFQSKPKAIHDRPKYRMYEADSGPPLFGNIMYDRRVVRGNTYAQTTLPLAQQPDPIEVQRKQEIRRRAIAKQRAREQLRQRSPPPVDGRAHMEVQTELYLEAITDRVEEADVDTQTDAFLDRPPTPLFIPAKSGKDVESQIYEGDLFDFNLEVKPILEVLVGKTMEQSLIEVLEEEELANLRQQQREFEEIRNAELVEMQRLEEQERRHREEKERRICQQRKALEKEKETAEKIAARAFAQSYLADLVPSVFSTLRVHGYFYDPVERDIEEGFLPDLVDAVARLMQSKVCARTLLDELLRDVCNTRLNSYEPPEPEEEDPEEGSTLGVPAERRMTTDSGGQRLSFQEPVAVEQGDEISFDDPMNYDDGYEQDETADQEFEDGDEE